MSKSYCIHNGFDTNRVRSIEDIDIAKKNFNITTDYVVGMVARFHERKDYNLYIRSALKILQKRNNVTFVTVGDGNTLNGCMGMVPEKYKDQILFLGKQKNVESIINLFDIGVLASYEEGISNSIMEYMALGKPVVATKHGGNEEIVQDKKTGYLVKPNDMDELTGYIELLLDNKDLATAMGAAGKERLEKEFSIEKMTDAHISLYKNLFQ
jgi:glycosyltransferase involved in cell wall biosynthesis